MLWNIANSARDHTLAIRDHRERLVLNSKAANNWWLLRREPPRIGPPTTAKWRAWQRHFTTWQSAPISWSIHLRPMQV